MSKTLLLSLLIIAFLAYKYYTANHPKGYQHLDAAGFKEKLSQPNVVVLDVRTKEEMAQGRIKGATNLDFYASDFGAKLDKLQKDKTYLVYCRSGNRSARACSLLAKKGYESIYNLKGGYLNWPG